MLAALLGALSLFHAAPAAAQSVPTIILGNSAAPTNLSVSAGDESLTVTWGAPTGNYNRGIWVQYREQGGNWTFSSTSATSPHTISNLTNGTTYDVRVFGVTCCNAENNQLRSPFATGSGTPEAPTPSSDADLTALTASTSTSASGTFTALTLSPSTFAADTTAYTASVANARTHVKLTPTVNESNATVGVRKGTTGNFATVASGSASAAIALDVGSNAITVRVTAQDSTTKDYTVTVTRAAAQNNPAPTGLTVSLGPASFSVNEGKKVVLKLGFSGCKNNNYVGIPVITTRLTSESRGWRLSRGVSEPAGSPDVLSYGPDHDFGLGNPAAQRHTLTPPTHSCGSGDVYIDTYRDCDTDHETFTVELDGDTMRWPPGYGRGSQYKVTVTIIDDGGQEFCTRTPPPARQPADQPPPNTEETDTDDGTPATPANTGGSGGGGGTSGGLSGPPAGGGGGGGGGLPPSGSSDEPPPEDDELSTLCSQEDRETLGNFYETTGGENWDENENWNSDEAPQEWFGVETDEDGNVVSLRLSENSLSGDTPEELLSCLSELKELALWGNDDLSGEVPEELVLAVERAVLRDIAEMLNLNPEWFENYEDPYNFEDWHEGVTTDDDGRVVELDLPGEVPGTLISQLRKLRVITTSSEGGGCALTSEDDSSAFSLFLLALLVFAALGRTRARG